jgi:hypothetical protein
VARAGGFDDLQHLAFNPLRLNDSDGKSHEFHFRTFLFGAGVAVGAVELREGDPAGYQF